MSVYVCNICGFKAPADNIGAILMLEHIKDEHPEHWMNRKQQA